MQMDNLKTRILIPMSLTLAILLSGFVVSFYRNQNGYLNANFSRTLESAENLFEAQLDNDAQMMGVGLEMLLRDKKLLKAFKIKDRKALLKRTLPLFKQLRSNHHITHLYYTGPDRVNILRVHKPHQYGDKIDRYTTLEAEKSEKISYGIELGPLGTFTLRVVAPWYEGHRLIGYVEFGEEIEHIVKDLHGILGVEIYVLIEKKFLNRRNWNAGMKMLKRKAEWNQFPSVVMVDQTMEVFPEDLNELLEEEHPRSKKTEKELSLNDRRLYTGFIPLKEVNGREVGDMVIMSDVTVMVKDLHTTIVLAGIICFVIGSIFLVMFYFILGQAEFQIAKSSKTVMDSEKKLRVIFDTISNPVVMYDNQGHPKYLNPAFVRIFGWSFDELEGRRIPFVPDNQKEITAKKLKELYAFGKPVSIESKRLTKDGKLLDTLISAALIKKSDEEPDGLVVNLTDITQRKVLETQVATIQRMESIGRLSAGIAHEINTPIQYIGDNTYFFQEAFNGMCVILQKYNRLLSAIETGGNTQDIIEDVVANINNTNLEYFVEEIPIAIKQTMEGVEHVSKIVHSLKEFAHPGVDEMTEIDINEALESTIVVSRNEWKYVAGIEKDFDPTIPLVSCFPGELNQAFLNIIINATHAIAEVVSDGSNEKGVIRISTKSMGDSVEIRISDTGPGIPDDIRSMIFDPFFTTKDVGKGTGQGLAMAHSVIVGKHGASLYFETETGKGTTFVIKLPVEKDTLT